MIEPVLLQTLRLIDQRLAGEPLQWAVTGSLGMALQGMPVTVRDIDLQAAGEEAYAIERRLAEYSTRPVAWTESERVRSHYGALEINGIQVELMSGMQARQLDGSWGETADLGKIRHMALREGIRVPVLSLAYEANAYAALGRADKAAQIQSWAEAHPEINAATNYRLIFPWLGTAGQPAREQFHLMAAEGYQTVINLAMDESPSALPDEEEQVAAQGLEYVHLPVIWELPELEDLDHFFDLLEQRQGKPLFVHCILNYRVSSFVFLYRVIRRGEPIEAARQDLAKIWQPDDTWQEFIDLALDRAGIERSD